MDSVEDIVEMAAEENAEEMGDFGDFMANIEQGMLRMIQETTKAPQTALEHWQAFSSAVDWSETWIRGLIAFHLTMLALAILTRRSETLQSVLFAIVCVMAFMSEQLNAYCAVNWTSFARQNYFDHHGVFAGIMYSGPLLVIGLVILINFLVLSSSALIKAKKLELARKINSKAKEANKPGEVGGAAAEQAQDSKKDR